jgi:hypothetical protein
MPTSATTATSLLHLHRFQPEDRAAWADFLDLADNATIFHSLDFLDYHGDRFKEEAHHLLWRKGERLFAALPLGVFEEGGQRLARSPYGASWGGLVHESRFKLKYALEIVGSLVDYLRAREISECVITPPPSCYYGQYNNHFEFALVAHGFQTVNRELTSVIDLRGCTDPMALMTTSARSPARKAKKHGVQVVRDAPLDVFYPLLEETKERLGGDITHTLADLQWLQAHLPGRIKVDVAYHEAEPIAGNLYFDNKHGLLCFYLSHRKTHDHLSAPNLLIYDALCWAVDQGRASFDFGCSSVRQQIQNLGVSNFKENFGARGLFRETYRWKADPSSPNPASHDPSHRNPARKRRSARPARPLHRRDG